ncbi:MAG: signal peptide peptidase SppA [Chloroflexi bacterium]|nr:signal peptide peptidase SppA [Chloroflexota bacterium]
MVKLINRKRVGVIQIFGTIGAGVRPVVYEDLLASVQKDSGIKALVLDIDSPGGSVSASDYLYRKIAAIAEKKPVVASVRGTGASGAYMLCCAAHRVVASPGALIGSIGVISVRPVLEELLGKLGVEVAVNKSGALKDMGALWRKATPGEDKRLQALIDEAYEDFVSIVAKARKMDDDKVREIATGEVFWAPKAKELGLIDELGDLDRAIDVAVEMSKAPRKVKHLAPKKKLMERLFSPFAESLADSVSAEIERRIWLNSLK